VEILGEQDPPGALSSVVSDKCVIFLEVSGVDLSKELDKIAKKITSTQKMIASIEKKMAAPGYAEKVPEDVREKNAQALQAEQITLDELKKSEATIKKVTG